jgi:hypothetical protein
MIATFLHPVGFGMPRLFKVVNAAVLASSSNSQVMLRRGQCSQPTPSPTLNLVGLNSHDFLWSSACTSTPRGMNTSPLVLAMVFSGRWMPSKICSMRPGPSSTDSGFPVRYTRSPTVSPLVSS